MTNNSTEGTKVVCVKETGIRVPSDVTKRIPKGKLTQERGKHQRSSETITITGGMMNFVIFVQSQNFVIVVDASLSREHKVNLEPKIENRPIWWISWNSNDSNIRILIDIVRDK